MSDDIAGIKEQAENGDTDAQYQLAVIYFYDANYEESLKFGIEAVQGGFKEALYLVGLLYENGLGTDENMDTAFDYYGRAVEDGHRLAHYAFGRLYLDGREGVIPQNIDLAIAHLYRAIEMGCDGSADDPDGKTLLQRLAQAQDLLENMKPESLDNSHLSDKFTDQSAAQDPAVALYLKNRQTLKEAIIKSLANNVIINPHLMN